MKAHLTVRIDEEVLAEVRDLAKQRDRSVSWMLNRLLAEAVKRVKP
jgi:predicted transcriptional regulator